MFFVNYGVPLIRVNLQFINVLFYFHVFHFIYRTLIQRDTSGHVQCGTIEHHTRGLVLPGILI